MVWTPLKNISQLGWLFPIYGKIKNVPNHQPDFMDKATGPRNGSAVDKAVPRSTITSCPASFTSRVQVPHLSLKWRIKWMSNPNATYLFRQKMEVQNKLKAGASMRRVVLEVNGCKLGIYFSMFSTNIFQQFVIVAMWRTVKRPARNFEQDQHWRTEEFMAWQMDWMYFSMVQKGYKIWRVAVHTNLTHGGFLISGYA